MFFWTIAVHLKSLVYRVSAKLPVPICQVSFNHLLDSIEYRCYLLGGIVHHTCTRMGSINRVCAMYIKSIIMDNSTQRITILLHLTAWNPIPTLATEKICNMLWRLSWSPHHLSLQYLIPHPFSKRENTLWCTDRPIVTDMTPWNRWTIFKNTAESGG